MPLPRFNAAGDLPVGLHAATLEDVEQRFGTGFLQRNLLMLRLERIYELASSSGMLERFIVFGSFVTSQAARNDVDVFMLMSDNLDVNRVSSEMQIVLDHHAANSYFGCSIFWMTRRGALGGEMAVIEQWQTKRDGGHRGIIEITG